MQFLGRNINNTLPLSREGQNLEHLSIQNSLDLRTIGAWVRAKCSRRRSSLSFCTERFQLFADFLSSKLISRRTEHLGHIISISNTQQKPHSPAQTASDFNFSILLGAQADIQPGSYHVLQEYIPGQLLVSFFWGFNLMCRFQIVYL